jgi:exodeoxyribonuclease VII large subunit
MSEEINGKRIFSLLEVTKSIQKTLTDRYRSAYWIKAEMNKLNRYERSGHCYPDLVEKKDGKVTAQIRAILWKGDFQKINANFQRVLKEPLKDGIKILFSAHIKFDPVHGLSLQILDIDTGFTLGDLQKEKQETVKKLHLEGIFTKNKQLELPVLPQRIAVISVETSKGYADFINVFESATETWNYRFFQLLFPSLLQGDNAVRTLIGQLGRIKKVVHHFDVVAIVRGGGGDIGLSCYNNYDLAREIALFQIPVITGIGHSTNETVAEMIAHENAITPTKLAEFIIQRFHDFSVPVQKAEEKMVDKSQRLIQEGKTRFASEVKLLRSASQNILVRNRNKVDRQVRSLLQQSHFRVKNQKTVLTLKGEVLKKGIYQFCTTERQDIAQIATDLRREVTAQLERTALQLANSERNIANLSPKNILRRGYSITRSGGKAIRSSDQVKERETLETWLYEGSVTSTVTSTKNNPSENE